MKTKINFVVYVVLPLLAALHYQKTSAIHYKEHGNNLWPTGRVSTDFGRDERIMPPRTYGHPPLDTDRWNNRQWFDTDTQDYAFPGCANGNCF